MIARTLDGKTTARGVAEAVCGFSCICQASKQEEEETRERKS
jgi:hypothetical protein